MPRKPSSPDISGTVVPFEPRRPHGPPPAPPPRPPLIPTRPPGQRSDEPDDLRDEFRHRMKTNIATLVVVVLLIWCGLWLADTIAQMRKTQDCVLSGRRNCSPITLPEHER